ncbi:MAG: tetratricopeptide repeat protein [Flavisolibacter sp.]
MERIEKLKEFLVANPDDSFLSHALALEYIKEGKDLEAKQLFETILQRDENYIGSYYHLGKLLEKLNQHQLAMQWYAKGMSKAKSLGDQHAYNELMSAYEDLLDS